jgi:hypothetical protein
MEGTLYSADFDGNVKAYSLIKKLVDRAVFKFSAELLDISVSPAEGGRNIEGISSRGQLQTINLFKSCKTSFHAELPAKNLVAVAFNSKQYYLLTADGGLFFKNTPFLKLDGTQWVSLAEIDENEIVVGSQDGSICVVTLE